MSDYVKETQDRQKAAEEREAQRQGKLEDARAKAMAQHRTKEADDPRSLADFEAEAGVRALENDVPAPSVDMAGGVEPDRSVFAGATGINDRQPYGEDRSAFAHGSRALMGWLNEKVPLTFNPDLQAKKAAERELGPASEPGRQTPDQERER